MTSLKGTELEERYIAKEDKEEIIGTEEEKLKQRSDVQLRR